MKTDSAVSRAFVTFVLATILGLPTSSWSGGVNGGGGHTSAKLFQELGVAAVERLNQTAHRPSDFNLEEFKAVVRNYRVYTIRSTKKFESKLHPIEKKYPSVYLDRGAQKFLVSEKLNTDQATILFHYLAPLYPEPALRERRMLELRKLIEPSPLPATAIKLDLTAWNQWNRSKRKEIHQDLFHEYGKQLADAVLRLPVRERPSWLDADSFRQIVYSTHVIPVSSIDSPKLSGVDARIRRQAQFYRDKRSIEFLEYVPDFYYFLESVTAHEFLGVAGYENDGEYIRSSELVETLRRNNLWIYAPELPRHRIVRSRTCEEYYSRIEERLQNLAQQDTRVAEEIRSGKIRAQFRTELDEFKLSESPNSPIFTCRVNLQSDSETFAFGTYDFQTNSGLVNHRYLRVQGEIVPIATIYLDRYFALPKELREENNPEKLKANLNRYSWQENGIYFFDLNCRFASEDQYCGLGGSPVLLRRP